MRSPLSVSMVALLLTLVSCSDDEPGADNDTADSSETSDAPGEVTADADPDTTADADPDAASDAPSDADTAPDGADALIDGGGEVPDEGRGDVPDLPPEDASDAGDCGDAGCVSALSPGALTQTCPIVGNATPFADDFEAGTLSDRWSVFAVGNGAVAPAGGSVVTSTGAVGAGGFSLGSLLSVCAFPPQDFTASAVVSVDAAGTGDFVLGLVVQRGLPGASLVVAAAQIASEEPDGEIGFVDDEDGPPPVEQDIDFARDTALTFALEYTLSSGLLSASITPGGQAAVFVASTTFSSPPSTLLPGLSIAAITAGTGNAAVATSATATWQSFTSDLTGALPAFVGTDTPLVLAGRTFDSLGTHYLAGGILTEIEVTDDVPGVDGVTDLNAGLVTRGSAAITFYTDLAEAELDTWLADFGDGSGAIAAFRESVFVAQGAANDYDFDESALTP